MHGFDLRNGDNRYEVSFSTEKAENDSSRFHDPLLRIQIKFLSADTGHLFQTPRYGLMYMGTIEREMNLITKFVMRMLSCRPGHLGIMRVGIDQRNTK